jgi:hypothetical protein
MSYNIEAETVLIAFTPFLCFLPKALASRGSQRSLLSFIQGKLAQVFLNAFEKRVNKSSITS